jgi:long-chain acyl-CoA synthetase
MLDEAAERWNSDPYALKKNDSGYVAVSFKEARERSREFAAWLVSKGFKKGDSMAVLGEGSPEWIMGEFGVVMAGCVSVPLSIKLLGEEIPFRLNHSEAKAILTTKNQLEKVLGSFKDVENQGILVIYLDEDTDEARLVAARFGIDGSRIVGFDEARVLGRAALAAQGSTLAAELDSLAAAAREDDTVTICYTSGTTGNPKGIMLTHLNYWTNCYDAVALFDGPYHFRTLLVLPVDHSFAHTVGLYTALVCGISLYFVDSRGGGIATLRNIPVNLRESQPIFLFTVPALSGNFMKKIISGVEDKGGFIEKLFKAGIKAGIAYNGNGYNRPSFAVRARNFFPYKVAKLVVFNKIRKMIFGDALRFCVGGGALLDVKQQEFFAAFGLPVFQGYGLTEAAPIISSNAPQRHKFGSSGAVAPSVECTIRHEDGSICAVGETGEIVIRGGNVMKGYFKNPEATKEALRDGWLWTGDLAYFDPDGFLVVVGREKALLIAEDGEKYSPEDIEEAITFSTDVIDQIMVYCDHKKYTTAFVTLEESKVKRLIKEQGIKTAEALLEALKVEFYRFRTDAEAKKVQGTWIPSAFHIVPEAFTDKNGTVNSTMKIVRHKIVAVYKDLVEYAYTPEGSRTENPRNIETLKGLFKLS